MKKEEIKIWLKNNSEKSDQEIESFLFSEMKSLGPRESWHDHYFLEDLKSPANGFSKNILKIIDSVQKDINGVPMSRRFMALLIDIIILGLFNSILQVIGIDNEILSICILFLYFCLSIYKFKTTLGLYFLKIKIEFNDTGTDTRAGRLRGKLFERIVAREIIFLSMLTGIGCIFYLIYGPFWDRITGAHAVWVKR